MKSEKTAGPLETAVRFLAGRDLSEQELRRKLRTKGYESAEIDPVIEHLREKGFLNDERLQRHAIEKLVKEKKQGLVGIAAKLRTAGLTVTNQEIRDLFSEEEEWETAQRLLKRSFPEITAENQARVARFLYNRGFSPFILSRLVEECRKHQY